MRFNPNGVVSASAGAGRNPVGVVLFFDSTPRVARASQPWALGRNPVGILASRGCSAKLNSQSSFHFHWVTPSDALETSIDNEGEGGINIVAVIVVGVNKQAVYVWAVVKRSFAAMGCHRSKAVGDLKTEQHIVLSGEIMNNCESAVPR